jgi:hypothetical protein
VHRGAAPTGSRFVHENNSHIKVRGEKLLARAHTELDAISRRPEAAVANTARTTRREFRFGWRKWTMCVFGGENSSVTYDLRLGVFAERTTLTASQWKDNDEFDY